MKVFAAILAGGSGSRMESDLPKQFLKLQNKEIIIYTIEAFDSHKSIDEILLVIPPDFKDFTERLLAGYSFTKKISIAFGGNTRQESSYNALQAINGIDDDVVLLHDAARPFVTEKIISDCIETAGARGACSVYISAVDTITEIIDGTVKSIPPRKDLYYTQTPQAFRFNIIKAAHNTSASDNRTDDVALVMNTGAKVFMVKGDPVNIKITSPFDMIIAESILKQRDFA